jgi:GntR family transcriptional repressor for pyruvate dehydrogenase complex
MSNVASASGAVRDPKDGSGYTQEPVVRRNVSELVVERIRELVAQRGLRPGDALPPVTTLAETYAVSTTSVREALKRLEGLGLVRGVQGKGFVLVQPDGSRLLEWVVFSTDSDRQRYVDLLSARAVLEPGMMPLIVQQATESDLQRLENVLAQMASTIGDWDAFNRLEAVFHLELYRATGNPVLEATGRVCCECFAIQHRSAPWAMEQSHAEHRALVDALRARDAATAQRIARGHMRMRLEEAEVPPQ